MLLGCRLTELTWDTVVGLVERRVAEDLTLDFKSELYSGSDKGRKDLAMDLAAFANASGGMVILGIEEGTDGVAVDVPTVELSDGERNRMVEILSTRVAPLLPDLTIGSVSDPSNPTHGVYLLLVPASDSTPHAVRREDSYVWPVREDRTKRCMHEPEIATRYRARFSAGQDQLDRLNRAAREGAERLAADRGWLAITMTPTKAGHLPADREEYRGWLREHFMSAPSGGLAVDAGALLGRRRVIFTDRYPYAGVSSNHHVELHSDGTGFAALALPTEELPYDAARHGAPDDGLYTDVDRLANWTVTFLDMLAQHAVRTGASGDLNVRAWLASGAVTSSPQVAASQRQMFVVEPFALNGDHFGGHRIIPGSRPLTHPEPLDTVVPPSIMTSPRDLVAAAADIVHELVVDFGAPPTTPLLLADGSVNPTAASTPRVSSFGHWARMRGLLLTDG